MGSLTIGAPFCQCVESVLLREDFSDASVGFEQADSANAPVDRRGGANERVRVPGLMGPMKSAHADVNDLRS